MYIPCNVNQNCGIYRFVNKRNGKFYVGSTKNAKERKASHFYYLKRGAHTSPYLQNAWDAEIDKSVFEFQMFIFCDESSLLKIEQGCIDHMKPHYNLSLTAGKIDYTPETLSRLSKSLKKWWASIPKEERPKYAKNWWENLSPEERAFQSLLNKQKIANWWEKASHEEKKARNKSVSQGYANMSADKKAAFAESCRAAQMSKTFEQRSASAKKAAEKRRLNKLALLAEAQASSDWPSEDNNAPQANVSPKGNLL